MKRPERNMWQFPWRYRESIAFILGIIIVGFILQALTGKFNLLLFHSPLNLIIGALIVFLMIICYFLRKEPFFKWFTGIPFSVTLIGAWLIMGITMGLIPQATGSETGQNTGPFWSGFNWITSSWAFVLLYFLLLLSLGALILRKLTPFKITDYAFYLNHTGLWILLFSSGLGAADRKEYVMHIREGETEWRVYSEKNDVLELPVAIRLNDFMMEEYPPQLVMIDRNNGIPQPEKKPVYIPLDTKTSQGEIGKWEIKIDEYIHEAVRNSDSTYREIKMPGSSPAAKISAKDTETGSVKTGWVCSGNIAQLYMTLNLDADHSIAMTRPEPKRFVSDIDAFTQDGKKAHALLEVNKPCKLGHWMLYQYGYDNEAGKMSTYSSIQLVYDPWLIPSYIGILLFAAGSVCMLWSGRKRKEEQHDME